MEETNEVVLHLLDAIAQLPPEMERHQAGESPWKEVTFFVPGKPKGKERPRENKITRQFYTPSKTKGYENLIKAYYGDTGAGLLFPEGEPGRLEVLACMPCPKSYSKRKLKAIASGKLIVYAQVTPDGDNMQKIVADALNGIAYHDDKQLIDMRCVKIRSVEQGLLIRLSEMAAPPAAWMDQRGGEAE